MLDDDAAESINWTHARTWLNSSTSREWMDRCVQQIQWDQPQVRVYGRWHRVPRLTAFLADHDVAYRYSGAVHRGEGWPAWFQPLLEQVRQQCSAPFNGCLFNLYRDGEDRMGWHADDEPKLMTPFRLRPYRSAQPVICSFAIASVAVAMIFLWPMAICC